VRVSRVCLSACRFKYVSVRKYVSVCSTIEHMNAQPASKADLFFVFCFVVVINALLYSFYRSYGKQQESFTFGNRRVNGCRKGISYDNRRKKERYKTIQLLTMCSSFTV
jgi:hypothetical protein